MSGAAGYFLPGLVLGRLVATKMREYRNGFPDFMDLMIVCSDAGMSMEAGIERVSKELAKTYPSLSQNLQLVSLELRAGRSLDDALKSLADRLSLDEVRSFATLLQQSKELGTSLSGALRVFSDEMRHKRMSLAEEKAHALAGQDVGAGDGLHPAGGADDRHHSDHRENDGELGLRFCDKCDPCSKLNFRRVSAPKFNRLLC